MTWHRTAAVANQVAYDLGYQGVSISSTFLANQVREPDETEWQKRKEVLRDRVASANSHHWTVILLGATVFGLALAVDYAIIHEFWSRLLSNEFGEVPPAMANTVAAKSFQVLFATLSIHYLLSHAGSWGRAIYSIIVFIVAFTMLLGIGLMWANGSLPEDSKVFSSESSDSSRTLDQFSKSLGVEPPKRPAVSAEVRVLKKHETLIRLVSLSVIFIVVASIGAISLDSAIRGFSAWSGGAVYDGHKEAVHGRRLNAEYASFSAEDPSIRERRGSRSSNEQRVTRQARTLEAKVNEFVSSYTSGVVDARLGSGRTERLLQKVTHAADAVLGMAGSDDMADSEEEASAA